MRFLKDPILLLTALKNGVALNRALTVLSFPEVTQQSCKIFVDLMSASQETPATDIPAYASLDNLSHFLNFCKETLLMGENDLFTAESLFELRQSSMLDILRTLVSFFAHPLAQPQCKKFGEIRKSMDQAASASTPRRTGSLLKSTQFPPPVLTHADLCRKVVEELVATETSYVLDLEKITATSREFWQQTPLSTATETRTSDAPHASMNPFGNIEAIYEFHKSILHCKFLEITSSTAQNDAESLNAIAELFVSQVYILCLLLGRVVVDVLFCSFETNWSWTHDCSEMNLNRCTNRIARIMQWWWECYRRFSRRDLTLAPHSRFLI